MKNPVYRFEVNGRVMHPIYKDDVSLDTEKESGYEFFRKSIDGNFIFLGSEFEYINQTDIETAFYMIVSMFDAAEKKWQQIFVGKFYKTDCEFDLDNKAVTVKVSVSDQYDEILKNIEEEYDIVQMGAELAPVALKVRPVTQYYVRANGIGSEKLTNYMGGMYWEEDVTNSDPTDDELRNFGFGEIFSADGISIQPEAGSTLSTDISGYYSPSPVSETGHDNSYKRLDGKYYAWYSVAGSVGNSQMAMWSVMEVSTGRMIIDRRIIWTEKGKPYGAVPLNGADQNGSVVIASGDCQIFGRMLFAAGSQLEGDNVPFSLSDRPANDIVDSNWDYTKVIAFSGEGFVYAVTSTATQTEPTKWGRSGLGGYFVEYTLPSSISQEPFYPIDRSQWGDFSIWVQAGDDIPILEAFGVVSKTIKDNYTLGGAIRTLLSKAAPLVEHWETPEYSQFLYGMNPITNNYFRLLIAPKSNYLKGQYDNAAMTGKISLKQIFDMLANVYRCYWYIDENNRLRIEHISYFRNGLGYDTGFTAGIQLTKETDPRTGKPWSWGVNSWEYEKETMSEKYTFEWADEVTAAFTGGTLKVVSNFVEEGKEDSYTASPFTSDVDYMAVMANYVSQDGFALLAPEYKSFQGTKTEGAYMSVSGQPVRDVRFDYYTYAVQQNTDRLLYLSGSSIPPVVAFVFFDASGAVVGTSGASRPTQEELKIEFHGKEAIVIPEGTTRIVVNAQKGGEYGCMGAFSLPVSSGNTLQWDGRPVSAQNYFAAYIYTVSRFYVYDMPAEKLEYNGVLLGSKSVKRMRKQTVLVPGFMEINPMKGIETGLGVGEVKKCSLNLTNRISEVELLHETR